MSVGLAGSLNAGKHWTVLYLAAIFENDKTKLHQRISEAEQAVVLRAHELFQANGDHVEEQEVLDDAMYTLRALGNIWENKRRQRHPQDSDLKGREHTAA
jgi:hypothetical protein